MAQSQPSFQPGPSQQALLTIRAAYKKFSMVVEQHECDDFARTELEDVRDAVLQIEKELAARQSLCNLRRLQPILQGLGHYSKVVEVLCNGTPFLPWVWAPIKLVLQISADFTSAFEKLIDAYGKIADALPRFDRLATALKHDHNFQAVLAFVYADILEFHRRAYKFVRRKSWKLFFDSMWGNFDSRFNSILARLAHHSELVDKEAAAVNISEAIERRTLDSQRWDNQEFEWRAVKLHAVMSWLGFNGAPAEDELDKLSRECLRGSCDWIVHNANVKLWLASGKSNKLVWLHGKPGAGKSIICSSLVQTIQERKLNVLFHFCTYFEAGQDGPLLLLRSLTAQGIQKDPDFAIYVHDEVIPSHPMSSRRALMALLPKLFESLGSIRLVVDGIDEWSTQEQKVVVDDIFQLSSFLTFNCKVLISSRDVPIISRSLRRKSKGIASVSLSDEEHSIHQAIEGLIEKRLAENRDYLDELDPGGTILPDIRRMLAEKSNGMFLWVRLVLDSLEFVYSPNDLREAVAHLPSDLSELYERIISRICNPREARTYQKARRILMWICHSRRPLNKSELVHGLALSPQQPVLQTSQVPMTEILELCKPLIEERKDGSVAFIHFSVQEYLNSDTFTLFKQVDAHHDLSFACATLLVGGLQLLRPQMTSSERLVQVGSGLFRLLAYAIEFWTEHFLMYATNGGDTNCDHNLIQHLSKMRSEHDAFQDPGLSLNMIALTPRGTIDERLRLVSHLHVHDLVYDVLDLRNLLKYQDCESGKALEDFAMSNDRTLFSRLAIESEGCVLQLLAQESVDGLPKEKLEVFKISYGSTAYRCRFRSCSNRIGGFASAQLREQHEATHVRRMYCPVCTCPLRRIGFKSKSGLDKHIRTNHNNATTIVIPAKVRTKKFAHDWRAILYETNVEEEKNPLSEYACKLIQQHILEPILAEESLEDFHPLIHDVPRRIGERNIKNLRDLEKTLTFSAPELSDTPSAYLRFCERSIQCLHATVDHLSEQDQRLPSERPYTNNYFLDLFKQTGRYAEIMARTREKKEKSEVHRENDKIIEEVKRQKGESKEPMAERSSNKEPTNEEFREQLIKLGQVNEQRLLRAKQEAERLLNDLPVDEDYQTQLMKVGETKKRRLPDERQHQDTLSRHEPGDPTSAGQTTPDAFTSLETRHDFSKLPFPSSPSSLNTVMPHDSPNLLQPKHHTGALAADLNRVPTNRRPQLATVQDILSGEPNRILPITYEELLMRLKDPIIIGHVQRMIQQYGSNLMRMPSGVAPEDYAEMQQVLTQSWQRIQAVRKALPVFLAAFEGQDTEGPAGAIIRAWGFILQQLGSDGATLRADPTISSGQLKNIVRKVLIFADRIMEITAATRKLAHPQYQSELSPNNSA